MKRTALAVACAISVLGACATQRAHMVKAGGSPQQYAADDAACTYEAELALANYGSGYQRYRSVGEAMGAGIAQGLDLAMRKARLWQLCMRTRGYIEAGDAPSIASTPAATPAPAQQPVAVREVSFKRIEVDSLSPGVTTRGALEAAWGPPTSQSAMGSDVLLQWIVMDGPRIVHVAILFDPQGVMRRVTHLYQSK